MAHLIASVHSAVDRTCSVVVSSVVMGLNLYYFSWSAATVAMPAMTAACCVTAATSKVLKRVVNQNRPAGAQKLSPGMPSNHATSLAFLSVVGCVAVDRSAASSRDGWGFLSGSAVQAAIIGYGLYGTALRVRCGHHTPAQVIVGYLFGFCSASLCVSANYCGYQGTRAGGRLDDLPDSTRLVLLWVSLLTCTLAFSSIVRGARRR